MTEATQWPIHGEITGPIVIIGYGSIGKGALPLIERHFRFDRKRLVVVDPDPAAGDMLASKGIRFVNDAVTEENYRSLITPMLTAGGGQGFCVNVSVDASSLALMTLARELGALYIDTVTEPWPGFYYDKTLDNAERTNYAMRETVLAERRANPGGPTAVSCCGANPGMVSWFVKQALLNIARADGQPVEQPASREGWARLMQTVGVKGIHVAERDTQVALAPKPLNTFWNTWSVEGFLSEGMQPAELGWGTHETWMPANARGFETGSKGAIFIEQPGAFTQVRTWCPTPGPQFGLLVTHNEALSITDYFTVREGEAVQYRPTCHYAYHPCNDAVLSMNEMFGAAALPQKVQHVLDESEIHSGHDELGVLLYGHSRNAYWYGSQLSVEEARTLAPQQSATTLQVTSSVLAGMVWALENPQAGIVETDDMDHVRCLEVQTPYLGPVKGYYTDWTPLDNRPGLFAEDIDTSDPWQFRNILVHEAR